MPTGEDHWVISASLVETCKLNGIHPEAYLADVITRIVNGHPNSCIDDLMPWATRRSPPSATWPEDDAYGLLAPEGAA